MSRTETEQIVTTTNDLDSKELVYQLDVSDVTMAETPPRQPIATFSTALRHCLCSHADYLYFSDTCLSKCVQEPSHIQQVSLTNHDFNGTFFVWH